MALSVKREDNKPDIYQTFVDGWDFTPDVGNGKSRGEVFTPRFIVDKMIAMGIIPFDIVYFEDYERYRNGALYKDRLDNLLEELVSKGVLGESNLLGGSYEEYREYISLPIEVSYGDTLCQSIQDTILYAAEKSSDEKEFLDTSYSLIENSVKHTSYNDKELDKLIDSDAVINVYRVDEERDDVPSDLVEAIEEFVSTVRPLTDENDTEKLLDMLIELELIHFHDRDISQWKAHQENKLVLTTFDKILDTTVQEPAVGTGNFTSTIVWHKVKVALLDAQKEDGLVDKDKAHMNILRAFASVYFFDIDPGNVEVTINRLVRYTDEYMTSESTVEYWSEKILGLLEIEGVLDDKEYTLGEDTINSVYDYVSSSMQEAEDKWGEFLNSNDSVLDNLYQQFLGEYPDSVLLADVMEIVGNNAQVYNGISEKMSDNIPGWRAVEIVKYEDGVPARSISMFEFLTSKKIREKIEENDLLEQEHYVDGKWDTRKNSNLFNKNKKIIDELESSIREYGEVLDEYYQDSVDDSKEDNT